MTETDSTKDLFKKWPQASILVELAQAAGLQVEKTDRDILTLRRNDRVATVGLKFRELSNDLVLFGTSFDGHQAQFSLGSDAATVLSFVHSGINS